MSLTRKSNERIRKDMLVTVRRQIAERKDRDVILFSISDGYDDAAIADILWTIIAENNETSTIVALHEKIIDGKKAYVYTPLTNNFSSLPIVRETKPAWYAIESKQSPNRIFIDNRQISDECIQAFIK